MDDKLIYISDVVGHRVIFLDQAKGQDVSYSLGVIPYRIKIPQEVTNCFGVCHYWVTTDTHTLYIGSISNI